ncbi:hypothetical protein BOTBODRAFT_143698 [Botryobasidium botryosum FD-172 SS1]|uniref:non-specific serine/threonine protein kinase n=1 Tax=Botryobasidium botryosum (strain FD-172 SS1) TaxID=930990 RepID=A0A067MQG3_BOTB1|nr:hypothetical protein BOTBODRAFT_143698 [Botryobasidium botryosum FD-172 SS1]
MSLSLLARRWVAKLPACFRSNATSQSPAVIFEGMFRLNHLEEGLTRTKEERAGYFPAALDQSLANGRYTILRKLGWGTAASVWLAKDEKQQSHVALKIMTAFWTEKQGAYEELILSRVKTANTDHPGRAYLPQLLDGFDVESHHGKHRVLVTDVSGPSLHALRHDHLPKKSLLPSSILKQWLRELLLALDYLHTEVGVIHSDIRLPNILLDFPKSEDSLLQAVHDEPPKFYPTDTKLQGPVPTFVSQPFPVPSDIIDGHTPVPSVKLIDLGGANWVENHTWHTCHNEDMRAPEVILRHPWGPPADIRALCCVARSTASCCLGYTDLYILGYPSSGLSGRYSLWLEQMRH